MTGPRLLRREEPQAPHLDGAALHLWGCIGGCMDQENAPDIPGDAAFAQWLRGLALLLKDLPEPALWEISKVIVKVIEPDQEARAVWAAEILRMKEEERAKAIADAKARGEIAAWRRLKEIEKQADALAVRNAEKQGANEMRRRFEVMGQETDTMPPVPERGPVILAKLRELGFDPGNLPPWKPGATNPARAAVLQALPSPPWTDSIFKRAWESLTDVLVYGEPSGND
jgi:hypothetical protein